MILMRLRGENCIVHMLILSLKQMLVGLDAKFLYVVLRSDDDTPDDPRDPSSIVNI